MRAAAVPALPVALSITLVVTAGCDDSWSALLDSLPIALSRAPLGDPAGSPGGALYATAVIPGAPPPAFAMLIGTGSPMTVLQGAPVGTPATEKRTFDLLDPASVAAAPDDRIVRGSFSNVSVLPLPLLPIGDGSLTPGGVLGGDILRSFTIDLRFGAACPTGFCSSMTFWNHLGADLGYLQDSGYAVLRFSLFGGGQVTALGDPDFTGERGPLVVQASRIVFRTCAVPDPFVPTQPRTMCCTEDDAVRLGLGVPLALMLDTSVGPLILSTTAWARIEASLREQGRPVPTPSPGGELRIATWPVTITDVTWTTLPSYALVDLEAGAAADPGPCVELQRARRIERVSAQIVSAMQMGIAPTACAELCDHDPREPDKVQNSAAYVELTGVEPTRQIPVAVIHDEELYLQGLRFDVRPEGPELDGVIGAGALGRSRVEIDYKSGPPRAAFSCEPDALRAECWAAARCPRLPDASYTHLCFGLPAHGLAPTCEASGC